MDVTTIIALVIVAIAIVVILSLTVVVINKRHSPQKLQKLQQLPQPLQSLQQPPQQGGWGMPAQQLQSQQPNWGTPATSPQQAWGWGTPAPDTQQLGGWGTPAQQQPQQQNPLEQGLFIPKPLQKNPKLQQQNPLEQGLFIPKPRAPYKPLGDDQPKPLEQKQVRRASPTKDFTGQTLSGTTCFLTGMPRSSCSCEVCVKRRGSV